MSAWCSHADVMRQGGCRDSALTEAETAPFIDAASEVLFIRSGRQYGVRTVKVRPENGRCSGLLPTRADFALRQGWCSCGLGSRRCRCDDPSSLFLGLGAVQSVTEVRIDGVAISASEYRVDEATWLVRLPDADGSRQVWPTFQRIDLDDDETGTWSVTLQVGTGVPEMGRQAAAELACQYSMAGSGDDDCALSPRMRDVVRDGISFGVLMPGVAEALAAGNIGLPLCDLFLSTVNPKGLRRRGRVLFPPPVTPPRRVDGPGGS